MPKTAKSKRKRAYGDGSVIELRPDYFRVVVSAGSDPRTGKRIRLSAYALTMEEARAKKAELLGESLSPAGPVLSDRTITLEAWLDAWVEKKRDTQNTHHYRLDKLRPVRTALGAVHCINSTTTRWTR